MVSSNDHCGLLHMCRMEGKAELSERLIKKKALHMYLKGKCCKTSGQTCFGEWQTNNTFVRATYSVGGSNQHTRQVASSVEPGHWQQELAI